MTAHSLAQLPAPGPHAWAADAVFYHIYPLGLCGAPHTNDGGSPPASRLAEIQGWIPHLRSLGVSSLYLGPLFESLTHGYDTSDYFAVDRRLGTNADLAQLVAALHAAGIRVILDAVFHHVGRGFWAFRDLLEHGERSAYRDWFAGVDFSRRSPYGDPFAYADWNGHASLVKLNLANPAVRAHLFAAVEHWVQTLGIDGLRLDAADALDPRFMRDLSAFRRERGLDLWLLGEVIHGDYRQWVSPEMLDSVTNYECYKGLYSSHNDRNYFEIAYSLNRQFGPDGIYRGLPLYTFADNHDVNRVATTLHNPQHLAPLYALLFTMPGVPSLYYGSEWGLGGQKGHDDWPLRPALPQPPLVTAALPELEATIRRLAHLRRESAALRRGDYRQLHVAHEQLAFARRSGDEQVIVAVNASAEPAQLELTVDAADGRALCNLLAPHERAQSWNGRLSLMVPPHGASVFRG